MRVLHLISSAGYYGAESMIATLAAGLQRNDCEVTLGAFYNSHAPNTELADAARRLGCRVEPILCRGKADGNVVQAISRLVSDGRLEMIHTHGYKADIYGYRASRNVRRPVVATCHNWCEDSARLRLYAAIDRWVLRRFSRVIAVSDAVATRLERAGVPRRLISLIANGVDLEALAGGAPDFAQEIGKGTRLLIGMVARLVPEKGCFDLVKAAHIVLQKCPEAQFVFIGDGPARSGLERSANELGIAESILFAGQRSDMPSIYASLDIFVLPSFNEGMPMSILEAMAARKPVIATRVGAVEKLISPGETGLLVRPGDVSALAQAIETLLANEAMRTRLGERAQAKILAQYSAAAMSQNYLHIYKELIGTRVMTACATN